MTYRLEDGKVAIAHVKSVRCICFELEETNKKRAKKKIYKLSLEQHEEIIANLDTKSALGCCPFRSSRLLPW